jgi:ribosome-associated protein
MLEITPTIQIAERDLHFDFIRAAGPGGQNVNKVATAVQLRFDVRHSSLAAEMRQRLIHLAGRRMTNTGVLVIEARTFRTQDQNKEAAIRRFVELVQRAAVRPKARRKTRPSAAAKESRLQSKRRRSQVKRLRGEKALE